METPRNIWEWAEEAAGYVGGRDRAAVRQELLDHMEDRLEVLLAQGMEEEEAQRRTMEAMGDPRQTGRLLRRVHQPWLTAALYGVQFLLIALLIPMLVYSGSLWDALSSRWDSAARRDRYVAGTVYMPADNVEEPDPDWVLTASRRGSCGQTARVAGHEVSVLAAWTLWVHPGQNETVCQDCYVVLRIETPPWETPGSEVLERNLRIVADGGAPEQSYLLLSERGEDFTPYSYACWTLRRNLTSCDYILRVIEPQDPDRLELIYEAGGEAFTLTVEFEEFKEAEGGTAP